MRLERRSQRLFIIKLRKRFPGSIIMKNDPNHLQGVPDILLLWNDKWAAFEYKQHREAPVQPNQEDYVMLMDSMSFASFVWPEVEEEVLNDLELAFAARGEPRVSERQQVSLDQLRRLQADRGVHQRSGS